MTHRKLLLIALLGLLLVPAPSAGQTLGVNGKARTYVSYLNVRDMVQDSVLAATVPGGGELRTLPDGTRVSCSDDWCRYYRSGDDVGMVPFLQDFELNAWSGIEGLRGYTHFRFRQPYGDGEFWPRMDSQMEALAAYIEYRRGEYTIKAGRMWEATALGFYNYDGGAFQYRFPTRLEVNAYGGLSLVRGLNQLHHTDLISSVESLAPREDAYLFGVHTRWRPISALATSLTYQRETTTNEGDLYSERIAGSARLSIRRASVDMEVKYDLATETTNLARVAVSAPIGAGLRASAEIRSYAPFFELWTIWGAFSPVGYDEVKARVDWRSPRGRFSARGHWSARAYGDTETTELEGNLPVTSDAYRMGIGARYAFNSDFTIDGEYRHDVGFAASRSGGDLTLQRTFGRGKHLAFRGTGFDTFSEFRVGSGRVLGGGLEGAMPLGSARIQASAMFYKHQQTDQPQVLDLNQTRLNLILEIPIGGNPGMKRGGGQ